MGVVKCPSCGESIQVPEKKSGLWWGLGCLLAVVAGMIVIAIVGLLAAIAIPSFVTARNTAQMNACVNNMRMLSIAKEQASIEYAGDAETLTEEQIAEFINGGLDALVCPAGGTYTINPPGQDPECSVHGTASAPTRSR